MLTEWQIYRMFEGRKGAWSTFQFLVRERLVAAGTDVRQATAAIELSRSARRAKPSAARRCRQNAPSCGARTAGSGDSSKFRSGLKRSFSSTLAVGDDRERALGELALAQLQAQEALDDLERGLRRGEEQLVAALADPERPADAAGEEQRAAGAARRARRSPSSRAAAPGRPERPRAPRRARRSPRSRPSSPARHARSRAASISSSSLKMIPLWTPTTAPWRIGWLLASIRG